MSHPSLTPAQAERLEMLAEEAAEVVQMCTKILRHGYSSYHPDDPKRTRNGVLLEKELDELDAIRRAMHEERDLPAVSAEFWRDVWRRKLRWTHHQTEEHQ